MNAAKGVGRAAGCPGHEMSIPLGLRAGWGGRTLRITPAHALRTLRTSSPLTQRLQDTPEGEPNDTRRGPEEAAETAERNNVLAQLRQSLRQRRTELEPVLKQRLEQLGKRWNEYSGYEEVIEAKAQTLEAEVHLKGLREQQDRVREEYMRAVSSRSTSQRTLNELLTRKADWSEADISTYTQLLRAEHSSSRSEKEAGERYESMERRVNTAWDDVVKKTLERYHLEQVWSDRVRAGSTYGGIIVAGLNGERAVEEGLPTLPTDQLHSPPLHPRLPRRGAVQAQKAGADV